MMPVIGITTDFEAGKAEGPEATQFLRTRYVRAVEAAGGLPMILPITADKAVIRGLLGAIHGLVITGSGPDLDPALYGETPQAGSRLMSPDRAAFELALARTAVAQDIPVLGICGGLQVMNVAAGGSLYQDIPAQVAGGLAHRPAPGAESGAEAFHEVEVRPATRLATLLPSRLRVNTSHHQAVHAVAEGFIVNAVAPDGVVEGIEQSSRRFCLGVQWHPEAMGKDAPEQRRLFEALIEAARGATGRR